MTMFDEDFLELMPETITVHRCTGADSIGNNTYDAGTSTSARVERKAVGRGRGQAADQADTTPRLDWLFFIPPVATPYGAQDKVVHGSNTVYLTDVTIQYDEDGIHHLVLTGNSAEEA